MENLSIDFRPIPSSNITENIFITRQGNSADFNDVVSVFERRYTNPDVIDFADIYSTYFELVSSNFSFFISRHHNALGASLADPYAVQFDEPHTFFSKHARSNAESSLSLHLKAYAPPISEDNTLFEGSTAAISLVASLYLSSDQLVGPVFKAAIRDLSRLLAHGLFRMVDTLLEASEVDRLSPEMMINLLRTSASVRPSLKNWDLFLAKASREIARRGSDPAKVFRGLRPV